MFDFRGAAVTFWGICVCMCRGTHRQLRVRRKGKLYRNHHFTRCGGSQNKKKNTREYKRRLHPKKRKEKLEKVEMTTNGLLTPRFELKSHYTIFILHNFETGCFPDQCTSLLLFSKKKGRIS